MNNVLLYGFLWMWLVAFCESWTYARSEINIKDPIQRNYLPYWFMVVLAMMVQIIMSFFWFILLPVRLLRIIRLTCQR